VASQEKLEETRSLPSRNPYGPICRVFLAHPVDCQPSSGKTSVAMFAGLATALLLSACMDDQDWMAIHDNVDPSYTSASVPNDAYTDQRQQENQAAQDEQYFHQRAEMLHQHN
jgi:hypothetical protein